MITRIEIQNFQSHRNTVLEPGPRGQLTVVTGPSDSGKTAILRALRWLFYNVPQGTDFIRVGCAFAKAIVTLADGTEVERFRTPSRNQYIIRREGVEPQVYEGFGSAVPLEVQEVLGVTAIAIGDLELTLNLAEQLDGPFLGKSISAGARAKVLGKLAGTEEIDLAGKTLGTDIYRRTQDEKRLSAEVEELSKQIAAYAWVPKLGERIKALEEILAGLKAAEERKTKLAALAGRLLENASQTKLALAALGRLSFLPVLEQYLADLSAITVRAATLRNARARLEVVITSAREAQARLARLAGTEEAIATLAAAAASLETSKRLLDLRRRLHESDVATAVTQRTVAKLAGADEAHQTAVNLASQADRLSRLTRIAAAARDLRAREDEVRAILERTAQADEAAQAIADIADLQVRTTRLANISKTIWQIDYNIERAKALLERAAVEAKSAVDQYVDELVRAGRCPTCGSIVNPELLKEAV
ncbi:MAG: AAA family ATPase [Betaproteobacteria bacterium]